MTQNTLDKEPKARALYHAGKSLEQIRKAVGVSKPTLIGWKRKFNWGEKGAALPQLEQKEAQALEEEARRHGITRARVLAKMGHLLDAKTALIPGQFGFVRVPVPEGAEIKDGKVTIDGKQATVVDDRPTQVDMIKTSVDVLNMKREGDAQALAAGVFAFYREQMAAKRGRR